jgi:hypothetical protein
MSVEQAFLKGIREGTRMATDPITHFSEYRSRKESIRTGKESIRTGKVTPYAQGGRTASRSAVNGKTWTAARRSKTSNG